MPPLFPWHARGGHAAAESIDTNREIARVQTSS